VEGDGGGIKSTTKPMAALLGAVSGTDAPHGQHLPQQHQQRRGGAEQDGQVCVNNV